MFPNSATQAFSFSGVKGATEKRACEMEGATEKRACEMEMTPIEENEANWEAHPVTGKKTCEKKYDAYE